MKGFASGIVTETVLIGPQFLSQQHSFFSPRQRMPSQTYTINCYTSTNVYMLVYVRAIMTTMKKIASLSDVKKVNLYFIQSHWRELQAISRKTGVPVAVMVRKIVADWLKLRKKK